MSTPADPAASSALPPSAQPPVAKTSPVGPATPPAAPPPQVPEEEPLTPELLEDEAIRGDFVLRCLVILMAGLYGLTQILETGTLVHVKTGQYLLSHGILPPRTDVFSYTAFDRPWINLNWGFDLLLAGLFAAGGWLAVSLLKPLLAGVAFGFAVHTLRPRIPTWWTAICIAVAIVACHKRITAQPYLITLVGLSVVFWQLERWRDSLVTPGKRALWLLVPVFLAWANLDPRMYLGLYLILLWGVGDLLASVFGVSTAIPKEARTHYWMVAGASVVAALVNPFLWQSLLSPAAIYNSEYPGVRGYALVLAGGTPAATAEATRQSNFQQYFPLMDVSAANFDIATWCALALVALALICIALNYFRETGHIAVLVGFAALPFFALYDLAATALVTAVIAGLNGQSWFSSQFKLDYNVGFWNVTWSRGGRAVTVLVIAVIAFFGGTGRLRSTTLGRTGFGLDPSTEGNLNGLATQLKDSFDDRPFNMSLLQGDMLIWNGKKVFADSRAGLYYRPARGPRPVSAEKGQSPANGPPPSGEQNLLTEHLRTRYALLGQPLPGSKASNTANWRKTFNAYKLTHVVPRLSGDTPDYLLALRLISGAEPFQATSFGPASLVVHRTDLPDPKLKAYLKTHVVNFVKDAFETESKLIEPRLTFARAPDFYERYFWSRRKSVPIEVQEALHLVRLAPLSPVMGDAMAHLGIRKAQEGLNKDPDCAEGYVALGMGYATLYDLWEGLLQPMNPRDEITMRTPTSIRYYQAVIAFNQAITADPDNLEARDALVHLYQGPLYRQYLQMEGARNAQVAMRPDLVLRELKALYAGFSAIPEPTAEQRQRRKSIAEEIKPFQQYVERVSKGLREGVKTDDPVSQARLAQSFAAAGCFVESAKVIEAEPNPALNPGMRGLRPIVLLETGDPATAAELLREFDNPALMAHNVMTLMQTVGLVRHVASSKTALADYVVGSQVFEDYARQMELQSTTMLLESFRLTPTGERPWPVVTLESGALRSIISPQTMGALWLDAGLIHLEAGQLSRAQDCFRQVLKSFPDAPSNMRTLVGHYLYRLTGKADTSLNPESEVIPIWHEDWKAEE